MAIQHVLLVDTLDTEYNSTKPFPTIGSVTTAALSNGAETTVAGTAIQVLAQNLSRKWCVVQNTGAANVRVGVSGVAATTGIQVVPGGMLVFEAPFVHQGAVFAIREGGTSSTVFTAEAV